MSRGRPKRTVRDLSRDPPAFEDRAELSKMQDEGPDMVLAIIGAALIEHEIEHLIIARLKRRDAVTILKCVENNGPMAGLYSKTVLAYAMGILDEVTLENANIVRLIRNAFAHAKRPIKFDAPEVVAELGKIRLPAKKRSFEYKALSAAKRAGEDARARFSILQFQIRVNLMKKGTAAAKRRGDYLIRRSMRSEASSGSGASYFGALANIGLGLINRAPPSKPLMLQEALLSDKE